MLAEIIARVVFDMNKPLWRTLFLCSLTSLPVAGHAADESRIEEILHRKNFSPDGQTLLSEMHATVRGCTIRLKLEKTRGCETDASFFSKTDHIDVRALSTNLETVQFKDFGGTRYESLKGAATFRYRSLYDRLLRFANAQESQIRDEEYEKFPTDVASRLTVLSKRFSEEIAPASYSMSFETTHYCAGVDVKNPLSSGHYSFYLDPAEMTEFANRIARLSETCEAG